MSNLQDYQVYEIMGKGGFATVYRAKLLKTEQEVAIKMVSLSIFPFAIINSDTNNGNNNSF
jgi:serine/threonine protein kinase